MQQNFATQETGSNEKDYYDLADFNAHFSQNRAAKFNQSHSASETDFFSKSQSEPEGDKTEAASFTIDKEVDFGSNEATDQSSTEQIITTAEEQDAFREIELKNDLVNKLTAYNKLTAEIEKTKAEIEGFREEDTIPKDMVIKVLETAELHDPLISSARKSRLLYDKIDELRGNEDFKEKSNKLKEELQYASLAEEEVSKALETLLGAVRDPESADRLMLYINENADNTFNENAAQGWATMCTVKATQLRIKRNKEKPQIIQEIDELESKEAAPIIKSEEAHLAKEEGLPEKPAEEVDSPQSAKDEIEMTSVGVKPAETSAPEIQAEAPTPQDITKDEAGVSSVDNSQPSRDVYPKEEKPEPTITSDDILSDTETSKKDNRAAKLTTDFAGKSVPKLEVASDPAPQETTAPHYEEFAVVDTAGKITNEETTKSEEKNLANPVLDAKLDDKELQALKTGKNPLEGIKERIEQHKQKAPAPDASEELSFFPGEKLADADKHNIAIGNEEAPETTTTPEIKEAPPKDESKTTKEQKVVHPVPTSELSNDTASATTQVAEIDKNPAVPKKNRLISFFDNIVHKKHLTANLVHPYEVEVEKTRSAAIGEEIKKQT